MSMRTIYRLAGVALFLGGLTAGICHLFNFDSPRDIAHLAQYGPVSAIIHLVLFAGGMVVLLGWFGYYALQYSGSGTLGLAAFVSLFLTVMWEDLLHCVLEFSVFPVLNTQAPYALPGLADATYRTTPIAVLLALGSFFLFVGALATAVSLYRRGKVAVAFPFAVTAFVEALAIFPSLAESVSALAMISLYFSMAWLGGAILWKAGAYRLVADRTLTFREDSQPLER